MRHAIGIDFGTSGPKAVLVDESGRTVGRASRTYATRFPHAGWAEQDPDSWWRSLAELVGELAAGGQSPDAIGLSGQMHAPVFLDSVGEVLTPAILWNDQRSIAECEDIDRLTDGRIADWTGNPPRTAFTASKILWIRRHLPEVYARIDTVLLPKDYIRFRLTGAFGSDPSDASGTNLFDVGQGVWSEATLAALDIPAGWLPPVADSSAVVGRITDAAAARTGLPTGIPVVAGASDQAAAGIGCGVVEPGALAIILGTSAVVSATLTDAATDPTAACHTFRHGLPDAWQMMGGVLSAGGAVQWYRDRIAPEPGQPGAGAANGYDEILAGVKTVSPGADGLIFLPYLTGERAPHNDPHARGGWLGLTARHERRHMARAVLEGICFALRQVVERIEQAGVPSEQLRVAGGGARGSVLTEILASVLSRPVVPVETVDASAYGAAILAMAGLRDDDPAAVAANWVRTGAAIDPVPGTAELYGEMYGIFQSLYPATGGAMRRLSNIDRNSVVGTTAE